MTDLRSILDLDDAINKLEIYTPEELRQKKLLKELSDYHTPRLLQRLGKTLIEYKLSKIKPQRMLGEPDNFIGPFWYYE